MSESSLRLVWVYPDLLSTYGDQGNALVVERRATQRRVPVTRVDVRSDHAVPTSGDIYLIGGGEDRPQVEKGLALCAKGVKQTRKVPAVRAPVIGSNHQLSRRRVLDPAQRAHLLHACDPIQRVVDVRLRDVPVISAAAPLLVHTFDAALVETELEQSRPRERPAPARDGRARSGCDPSRSG